MWFVAVILVLVSVAVQSEEPFYTTDVPVMGVDVRAQRVFRLPFDPKDFKWMDGGVRGRSYAYSPAAKGLPDLPFWMRYKYSHRHRTGFIYGVPPRPAFTELEVIAKNRDTFEIGILRLALNITGDEQADRGVKVKINNLNLEDIFFGNRLQNLKSIFKDNLWTEANEDLHPTFIASAIDVGYRRPLYPSEKDGLVISFGSNANYSKALLDLDLETSTLRNFPQCPRNFKQTTVERFFREKGFALDWCAFRLLRLDHELGDYVQVNTAGDKSSEDPPPENQNDKLTATRSNDTHATWHLPKRTELPRRDLFHEYLLSVGPAGGAFALLLVAITVLICIISKESVHTWEGFSESLFLVVKDCGTCCTHRRPDKPVREVIGSTESVDRRRRASSVQRQTDTLRRVASQRNVSSRLQTPAPGAGSGFATPAPGAGSGFATPSSVAYDTLSRNGTLSRRSMPREYLDSLPRPAPPPYEGGAIKDDEASMHYLV